MRKRKQRRKKGALVFSNLPEEIQAEIFVKLPVKSILTCRCVCKFWRKLLGSDNFIKLQLDHANPKLMLQFFYIETKGMFQFRSINYASISSTTLSTSATSFKCVGDVPMDYHIRDMLRNCTHIRMLGSCNGLICIYLNRSRDVCIWNPSTGESKKMQIPLFLKSENYASIGGFGFCYDSKIEDYKLLRIAERKKLGDYEVDVYTLGSKSWKQIRSTNHYKFNRKFPVAATNTEVPAFPVNGAFHWLGIRNIKGVVSNVIVSFDVSRERFVDILFPDEVIQIRDMKDVEPYCAVGVLEGCLSLGIYHEHMQHFDVWLMQDYGAKDFWTKKFSFSSIKFCVQNCFKLLWSFKNGEQLLIETDFGKKLCDPKNYRLRVLKIDGISRIRLMLSVPLNYVESLVSSNSIGA